MENVFGAEYLDGVETPVFGARSKSILNCWMDGYGTTHCSWGTYDIN